MIILKCSIITITLKKASHEAPFSLQTNESSQWLQAIEFGVALTLTLAWKLLRRDLT